MPQNTEDTKRETSNSHVACISNFFFDISALDFLSLLPSPILFSFIECKLKEA